MRLAATRWWPVAAAAAAIALLAVVLGGRAFAGEPVRGQVEGFRQTVSTGQSSYARGESVEIRMTVCRTRLWPLTTSGGGQRDIITDFEVLDAAGEVVADTTHAVRTAELRAVPWLPGMCRTARHDWDQRYWNREDPFGDGRALIGEPLRGEEVPPGTYRVRAVWSSAVWDEPPSSLEARTSAPFVIEP